MVLIPLASLIMPPIWGASADALRARHRLLGIASLGSAGGVLLLLPANSLGTTLGAMALFCLFRAGLSGLADAATHSALGAERHRFARVRVWGSVGYALFASLLGQLDAGSKPTLLLGASATLYLVAALSTTRIPAAKPEAPPPFARAIIKVVMYPQMALLLLGNVFYYGGHGIFDVYYGLHLRQLGFGDSVLGLAWGIGVSCETALMLVARCSFAHATGERCCRSAVSSRSCAGWQSGQPSRRPPCCYSSRCTP
jgi:PPP family 3-phenylpropionic acid transporter